jgi:hypothetical protein
VIAHAHSEGIAADPDVSPEDVRVDLGALRDIARERSARWAETGVGWEIVDGPQTDKPASWLILSADGALGQLTVWVSGEADIECGTPSDGGERHYDVDSSDEVSQWRARAWKVLDKADALLTQAVADQAWDDTHLTADDPEVPRAVTALVGLPDTTLFDHDREEARLRTAAINELLPTSAASPDPVSRCEAAPSSLLGGGAARGEGGAQGLTSTRRRCRRSSSTGTRPGRRPSSCRPEPRGSGRL